MGVIHSLTEGETEAWGSSPTCSSYTERPADGCALLCLTTVGGPQGHSWKPERTWPVPTAVQPVLQGTRAVLQELLLPHPDSEARPARLGEPQPRLGGGWPSGGGHGWVRWGHPKIIPEVARDPGYWQPPRHGQHCTQGKAPKAIFTLGLDPVGPRPVLVTASFGS